MKAASTALIALMDSGEYKLADIYTITLKSGSTLRYTSMDAPLTYGAHTYQPIAVQRTRTRVVQGIEVDTMEVRFYPDETVTVNNIPFMTAAHAGAFDGAHLDLERAYMSTWGDTSPGALHLFDGEVSEVMIDGHEARMRVWSSLALANIRMPRNVYQAACTASLYDAACGVSRAAHAVSGMVSTGSTKTLIKSGLGHAADHFSLGKIEFTSGQNAGVSRTVRAFSGGQFTLIQPLAYSPQPGDAFVAYPGCDKKLSTCQTKFNNRQRFRGYPWIPVPETAY